MENIPNDQLQEQELPAVDPQTNEASAAAEEEVEQTVANPEAEAAEPAVAETTEDPEAPETEEAEDEADIDVEAEVAEAEAELADEEAKKRIEVPATKELIVARMETLADHPEQSERLELDVLKSAFYKMLRDEKAKQYADHIAAGGAEDDFMPMPDPLEEDFKKYLNIVKEQRSKLQQAAERQKEINLEKKRAIIEQIKELASTPDEAGRNYETFRTLQTEWKAINPVPATAVNELWKSYQFCTEQFYDLLKTNIALRDYDFKKNLAAKTALCEEAEKLDSETDIIKASRTLQELHQQFREIGPVAKDLREELWTRFKAASTVINKKHAQYFEQLKAVEEQNLALKTAICEKIEAIDMSQLTTYAAWETATETIMALQTEWKGIGHTTKKTNTKIYERYRAACDKFFNTKAEHLKAQRKQYAQSAAAKTALCEQAEALAESTDWLKTADEVIKLQKQWKETGVCAHKQSLALWERFNKACNTFFERKKANLNDQHKEQRENLARKKALIKDIAALAEQAAEGAVEKLQELQKQWNEIGHVPFKEKDSIFQKYREAVDAAATALGLRGGRRQGGAGRQQRAEVPAAANNIFKLFEAKKSELNTMETNFSFLSANSKRGNSLIDSMQKKIDALKAEVAELQAQIKEQAAAARAAQAESQPQE